MAEAIAQAALVAGASVLLGPGGWAAFGKAFAINLAIAATSRALAEHGQSRQSFSVDDTGRAIMFRSSVAPRRVIYGEAVVSGPLIKAASSGTDDKYLHLVIALAGHECDSVVEVLLNGKPLADADQFDRNQVTAVNWRASANNMSIFVDGTEYTGLTPTDLADAITAGEADITAVSNGFSMTLTGSGPLVEFTVTDATGEDELGNTIEGKIVEDQSALKAARATVHLGTADQVADPDLVALIPEWTVDHRGRGVCYVHAILGHSYTAWPTGVPNFKVRLRGRKVYDPRKDTTAGGSGTHRVDDPSTWEWSANTALCADDYLRYQYGLACDAEEIDVATTIASANICEEAVVIDGIGTTQPRYTCNGTFVLDGSPADVLDELRTAMAGAIVCPQGQWKIYAGAPEAVSGTLTADDLRGPLSYRARHPRAELFNAVQGVFVNVDDHDTWSDFPPVTNATYEAQDGGKRIPVDIRLPFTADGIEAQRIAKIILERHRQQIRHQVPAKLSKLATAPWDVLSVTFDDLGHVGKKFQVSDWTLAERDDGLGVDLVLDEYADAVYDWNFGEATVVDPAPDTTLPDPRIVGAPTGLSPESGTEHLFIGRDGTIVSTLHLAWTRPADAFLRRWIVQIRRAGEAIWQPAGEVRTPSIDIRPVEDGVTYELRVRAENTLGALSDWTQASHTVIGKSEPPDDVDTFLVQRQPDGTRQFTWTMVDKPVDLDGWRIRYAAGSESDWDAMTDLHDGLLTASPYETNQLAAGTYTFAIKTVDTSGNESATGRFITLTIGDPRLRNALLIVDPRALGWPGTKTACQVDTTGALVPNSTDTWADLPATWAAWTSWISSPVSSMSYQHTTIDLGAVLTVTPLVSATADGSVTIEERHSDDDVTYSAWTAAGAQISGRYIQVRITVATPGAAGITQMQIVIDAETIRDDLVDVDTSTLSGTTGDRRLVPSASFNVITRVSITLQNTGPGWTWELIDKSVGSGPRIKIYNASGVLADATIDAEIVGA